MDSHATRSFQYIRSGIDQAGRAWPTAADVINARPPAECVSF
jgi:hypothetical protein